MSSTSTDEFLHKSDSHDNNRVMTTMIFVQFATAISTQTARNVTG
jgi:hypothetical protein